MDYRLFQNTAAWELAKAVEDGNVSKIKEEVSKNKSLLNFRDTRFGQPSLKLAIMNSNFKSVKALVELGADPNMQDTYDGSSPLMEAAQLGLGGFTHDGADSKYLKFLLKHGGDANAEEKGVRRKGNGTRYTPLLIAAQNCNLEYVKILVDAGANVNYNNEYGLNPLGLAVISSYNPDVVIYLLEKGADFRKPIMRTIDKKNLYITDGLRFWRYDLGSDLYEKKMQIVKFLKDHGMDYRQTEIPKQYLDKYSKSYLEKY